MEYVRATTRIAVPIERVWAMVAGFGALVAWCPAIKACDLEGEGVGSVRTAHLEGLVSRERLEAIDAKNYTIVYSLLEPGALPLRGVRSTMQLSRLGAGTTDIVWSSVADETPAPTKEVIALVDGFYRQSLAALKTLLEKA